MTHRRQFTSHCVWLALVGALIPRRAWLQSGDVVKVLVGFHQAAAATRSPGG